MTEKISYILEAEDKGKSSGMTAIGDDLLILLNDMANWMRKEELEPDDVRFARLLRLSDLAKVADIRAEDGELVFVPCKAVGGVIPTLIRRLRMRFRYWRICRKAGDVTIKEVKK